jgi:DNA-binding helix-hairpin-helix protein with protein kinase domain
MRYETENGTKVKLGKLIGSGGQGTVYQVDNHPLQAVKLYNTPTLKLENKIKEMVSIPTMKRPSVSHAAWPLEPVYETSGFWWWKKARFVGYNMPYVANGDPIFQLYIPKERKRRNQNLNWGHMHLLAFSLATVFKQFHDHNLVIGDVNCKNILVTPQLLPVIIDVDSIQISPKYTTDVGFEEYTPPELVGKSLKNVVRDKRHDLFGLGFLIFQLLMNGCSPFAGVPKTDFDGEYVDKRCKELGIFPFYDNPYVGPPRGMPTTEVFHPQIASGFISCFIKGRKNSVDRPTADAWQKKIKQAESVLTRCHKNENHVYSPHLSRCPWCK